MKSLDPIVAICLLVCTSCQGQGKPGLPSDSIHAPQSIIDKGLGVPIPADEMETFLESGVDPYFVETNDTISSRGPQCIVRNLIQDHAGNIWLATWHGIIKYDGKNFINYTLKEGLIHFHVVTLFEDSRGHIWFSMARGGVYRYDGKSFMLFNTRNGLPDNSAHCIEEDKQGNLWFGTENGLSRYDGKKFANFSTQDGLLDRYINAILADKEGTIWIGSNKGINYYRDGALHKFADHESKPLQQVVSLFEDQNGSIWIGSGAVEAGGQGLCRYDGHSVNYQVSPYFVMYMCQDQHGNLWMAHNKGADSTYFALYSYNGNSFHKTLQMNSPDNPAIFGMIEDDDHHIWFGTAKGVCRYDGSTFHYFTD